MTGEQLIVQDVGWSIDGLSIIDGVCLRALAGTVTGLLGPNGSGKSTLLSVASGVRRPSNGVVHIGGDDMHALDGRVRARRVALLEQQASTELDLRVEDVVDLGRTPYRSRWGAGDPAEAAIIADAMARADVAHLRGRRWLTLSGGERQRVQLARALAQQPSVLLMDEPTNHLDLRHQIELLRLVRGLGITVLAALHDLDHALAFCDQVIVLSGGRVVAAGEPRRVVTAELLHDVYGVRAAIVDHPLSGRPHLVWDER